MQFNEACFMIDEVNNHHNDCFIAIHMTVPQYKKSTMQYIFT